MAITENQPVRKIIIKRVGRISDLPDEILSHILSFLPTRYAVQTAALSRRYRHIWTSVNSLQFDERETTTKSDFMETVDKFLIKRDSNSSIGKFSLYCFLNPLQHIHRFNHWISEVIKHDVRYLDIRINTLWQPFKFSSSVYKCQTLVALKVNARIELDPNNMIYLPCLKVLHLIYVNYVNDESASMLLSGCPVVEELYIWRKLDDGVKNFRISSPKLKRFTLGYYDKCESKAREYKVRVSAPSLEFLSLVNEYPEDIKLDLLSSLVEARLDLSVPRLNSYCKINVTDLLWKIYDVKRLELCGGTILSQSCIEDCGVPEFDNLTHLELSMNSSVSKVIHYLLVCAIRLKSLVLDMGTWTVNLVPNWKLSQQELDVPDCLWKSLEVVEVRNYNGKIDVKPFLKYILKYGKVLKKISIFGTLSSKKRNLLDELLLSPQASKNCKIQLIRCKCSLP